MALTLTPDCAVERSPVRTLGAAARRERRPRTESDISKCSANRRRVPRPRRVVRTDRRSVAMPPKPAMAALKAKLAATTALKKGAEKGKEDGAAADDGDGEAKPAAKAKPIPSYLRPTAAGKAKQAEVKHQYKVRWMC